MSTVAEIETALEQPPTERQSVAPIVRDWMAIERQIPPGKVACCDGISA